MSWSPVLVAALSAATMLLAGCAHSYVDEQGRTHVIGLVALTLPAGGRADAATPGAELLRLRTIGLSFVQTPGAGNSLVLGYSDSTIAWLRDNTRLSFADLIAQPETRP